MHEAKCHTFIEAAGDCIVNGMPGEAKKLKAADDEVALKDIAAYMINLVGR